MRNISTLHLIVWILLSTHSQTLESATVQNSQQEELNMILKKCAEYCERLENLSLYFVCEESITEEIRHSMPTSRYVEINRYLYDYQLIRQGDTIKEQRILLKENGKEKKELNAPLKTKRFHYKYIIFGPLGLLSQEEQKNHEYKILTEVSYNEEEAVIIEALPKNPHDFHTLYGKIWISKKNFNILKIEWEQQSLENFKEIEEIGEDFKGKPKITFVSEFGFEKNNIRFPSKFFVDESYILPKGTRYFRSETTVVYDNYKYFTVGTKVKIKS